MKIIHSADWHLGEFPGPVIDGQNARLIDTVHCLDYLCQKAEEEQPDAILVAGDLFHKSQMWANPMLHLIEIAASKLRRLAAIAPTVLMFGTANHDSLDAFKNINSMQIIDLYVVTTPKLFPLFTKSGTLQIAALPGLDKNHFRTLHPGMDPAEENQFCSKLLGDLVLGLGASVDPSMPSVLMAHYSVAGCELDNGQQHIFTQNEVILPREAIAASPFDLVCLGHIHRAQEVPHCGRPVFYSGSINGLTFNEEGQDKGFWIHELTDEVNDFTLVHSTSRFIKTPSRKFWTTSWNDVDVQEFLDGKWPMNPDYIKEKIIRIHYTCSDELNKQLNRKALEKSLYDAGAFYVAEIKPVQIVTALDKQEMSENDGPMVNLIQWLEREGFEQKEIALMTLLAGPMINAVSAKTPAGRLSGVFVPRSLTVKNYRSYREASFDFDPITFATVNGPNGVGKSALFMDSISDCLYEETREGDLTGWITSGEKSGSITFEFSMGESIWRVVRTRARSGRTTVALQEQVDGAWADRGADKVRDTQEKIVALLGMDALTFRCCGLIMQDAYGLFLEADREERMGVLGNILGLGVYESLEKLAKEKVTETNRELQRAKDLLAILDERLKVKPSLQAALTENDTELARVVSEIAGKEAELKEAEELVRSLTAKAEKAEELRKQIEALTAEADAKVMDRAEQLKRREKAQAMLEREAEILGKAAEYETAKEQVTTLKAKLPQLKAYDDEENQLVNDRSKIGVAMMQINKHIAENERVLANRVELEKAATEYREAVTALEGLDALSEKWTGLDFKVRTKNDEYQSILTAFNAKRESLVVERKTLTQKTAMLADAKCVDIERAECAFLADAKAAREKLKLVAEQEEALKTKASTVDICFEGLKNLQAERDTLGYNPKEHRRLKDLVAELRPKAEQAAQLSAKAELLQNLQEQKRQQKEQVARVSKRLNSVQEWTRQLNEDLKPLTALEVSLPKLEAWVKAKDQLPAARQAVTTAAERISELDREIAAKKEQCGKLEQERNLLLIETATINGARVNADNLSGYIKHLQAKQNDLHGKQGGLKAQLEAMEQADDERRQVVADIAPLAATLTRYQTIAKAFGQDGIPFSIVRAVVPELSAQANEILGQMTGGKMSLEMKTERVQKSNKREVNALEIWINDYQWGNMPYKSRSGGQKVRAALSVAFALAELKAQRAGIRLGMLFVDEPSFLDQQGSEVYVDALEAIVDRYTGMKVIAISHDPVLKARFPQVIMVEDSGDAGSRVRVA